MLKRLHRHTKTLHKHVKTRMSMALVAAFALVIALTWAEFIKEAIHALVLFLGLTGQTWLFKLLAAVVITIVCVVGIDYASAWEKKN